MARTSAATSALMSFAVLVPSRMRADMRSNVKWQMANGKKKAIGKTTSLPLMNADQRRSTQIRERRKQIDIRADPRASA
jgi:hypothetical protein